MVIQPNYDHQPYSRTATVNDFYPAQVMMPIIRMPCVPRILLFAALIVIARPHFIFAQEVTAKGDPDIESVLARGVLRVAVTQFDMPAFHQKRKDGSIVGPEIDLAGQIAKAL